jgi:hypothetical protein
MGELFGGARLLNVEPLTKNLNLPEPKGCFTDWLAEPRRSVGQQFMADRRSALCSRVAHLRHNDRVFHSDQGVASRWEAAPTPPASGSIRPLDPKLCRTSRRANRTSALSPKRKRQPSAKGEWSFGSLAPPKFGPFAHSFLPSCRAT